MPSNFKYRAGLSSVGAYQVSGVPYMSGSHATIPGTNSDAYQVSFPYITQWVIVENMGSNALRVGFSNLGARGKTATAPVQSYFVLAGTIDDESVLSRIRLDVRVKDIHLSCDHATNTTTAQITAGLTLVPTEELTGTYNNWTGSSGVG
jgi:hypothetical protein